MTNEMGLTVGSDSLEDNQRSTMADRRGTGRVELAAADGLPTWVARANMWTGGKGKEKGKENGKKKKKKKNEKRKKKKKPEKLTLSAAAKLASPQRTPCHRATECM